MAADRDFYSVPQLLNKGGNKHHLSSQKSQERQRGGMKSVDQQITLHTVDVLIC